MQLVNLCICPCANTHLLAGSGEREKPARSLTRQPNLTIEWQLLFYANLRREKSLLGDLVGYARDSCHYCVIHFSYIFQNTRDGLDLALESLSVRGTINNSCKLPKKVPLVNALLI